MTTVSATVSRTTLSLSALTITAAPYEIMGAESGGASGIGAGQSQYSRLWATSPYVAGGVQVMSVLGIQEAPLRVYVYDSSQANVETDLATLIAAMTQPTFTLTLNLDAATYAWSCYNADFKADDWPAEAVVPANPRLGVTFSIPRSPIPVTGPI